MDNLWTRDSATLGDAYARASGLNPIRFLMVTRRLDETLSVRSTPAKILDFGGGFGVQAVLLARAGHSVRVVDFDEAMLSRAREHARAEPADVQARIEYELGDENELSENSQFDLVCCHSVLMYQHDPISTLVSLGVCVRPGGHISVLSLNTEAEAFRPGMLGDWRAAIQTLLTGSDSSPRHLSNNAPTRTAVESALLSEGFELDSWHGIGVFSDHLDSIPTGEDRTSLFALEWLAGMTDPYRQVARTFHLVGRKSPNNGA